MAFFQLTPEKLGPSEMFPSSSGCLSSRAQWAVSEQSAKRERERGRERKKPSEC